MLTFSERSISLRAIASILFAAVALGVGGCARDSVNPSFSVSRADARQALDAMASDGKRFERPVVVLGGYLDPGLGSVAMGGALRRVAGGQRVIGVSFVFDGGFDRCRRDVVSAVEAAWPCADPGRTSEVDVVALSMGGVVARYAAIEKAGEKRLRIHRLYTVSSPHRGAAAAMWAPPLTALHWDMREGSSFICSLEASGGCDRGYAIVPYVRLGDWMVGPEQAAPVGQIPWWVSTPWPEDAHLGAAFDPRILADIARKLRGEVGFTREPAAELPTG